MSTATNVRRVASLTWSASFGEPVGARFMTRNTRKANTPSIIITDECVAIEKIEHSFEFKYQGIVTPPTPGANHDAVAVLQTYTNSTGGVGGGQGGLTVTLPTSMFDDEEETDANTDPATQMFRGHYIGTSLQPRTVA